MSMTTGTQTLLDQWLKWTACAVTLTGAACTSLDINPVNIYLLNLGAAVYLVWSWRIREWSLIVINAALLTIYAAGTVRNLLLS
jgi:hypothetical protein